MNAIRFTIFSLILLGGLVACSSTSDNDMALDRQRGADQQCGLFGGPTQNCCGYITSESGVWKAPTSSGQCSEVTSGLGVFSDGYCTLECLDGEVVVELQPRIRGARLLGCTQCARP